MSINSCLETPPVVTITSEVEVIGLSIIKHSTTLVSLFVECKAWILSLWKDRTDQIKSMTIMHKVIGRNAGFVVHVKCTHPESTTTFYAKIQHASMDTVLVHHLLKNMNCGPDRFYIALLEKHKSYYHGVITEEVKDWTMASNLTCIKPKFMLNEKKQIITTSFLLTLLIELGRFGNIPNNRDNWGFVDAQGDSVPYPHMSMIDFSRGGLERDTFLCEFTFRSDWQDCLEYLWKKWQPRCGPIEDLQLFRDRMSDFYQALMHGTCIEDEIQQFPFLQSRKAFVGVLQSACDKTTRWLQDAVDRARASDLKCPSITIVEPTKPEILSAFRNIPPPIVGGLASGYTVLLLEYVALVREWNVCLEQLLQWFPFPSNDDTPSSVTESSVAPMQDSNSEVSNDGVTASNVPTNETEVPEVLNAAAQ